MYRWLPPLDSTVSTFAVELTFMKTPPTPLRVIMRSKLRPRRALAGTVAFATTPVGNFGGVARTYVWAMAILIDPPLWPALGTLWSHMVANSSGKELHAFAARLGVPRRGFDSDHYDVPKSFHAGALALGVEAVGSRELFHRLRSSGVRVRAGLGGHVMARWNDPYRAYHDERHLHDVLLALDRFSVRGERIAAAALLAAWFHDAVYRGSAADDGDSARLAADELSRVGADRDLVGEVGEQILATDPAHVTRDPAEPLAQLLDSSLWSSPLLSGVTNSTGPPPGRNTPTCRSLSSSLAVRTEHHPRDVLGRPLEVPGGGVVLVPAEARLLQIGAGTQQLHIARGEEREGEHDADDPECDGYEISFVG